ncbi:MAG: gliding motility-associated C-terminal domain-containing protein [Bacteroidales bacterium]
MYKKLFIFFIYIFSNNIDGFSQSINLVSNPSFEEYTNCPDNGGQIYYAFPWTAATNNAICNSDYFNKCSVVLSPIFTYQQPRTGIAYAGIELFNNPIGIDNYREYLEVKLKNDFKKDKKYCGEFYISFPDYGSYAISNIGMYFSPTEVIQINLYAPLPYIPQIKNTHGILKDTINWMKVNGSFIASGGEQYLVIGNFDSSQYVNYITVGSNTNSRYLIDDVLVCECSFEHILGNDTTLCNGKTLLLAPATIPNSNTTYQWQNGSTDASFLVSQPGIYSVSIHICDYNITVTDSITVNYADCTSPTLWIPNSFTPNGDGLNDKFEYANAESFIIKTYIYNRWGQLIFEGENTNFWGGTFKGKIVPLGVYAYKIEAMDKRSKEKKIHSGKVTVIY